MKKHKHTAACGRVAASGVKVCASAAKRKRILTVLVQLTAGVNN